MQSMSLLTLASPSSFHVFPLAGQPPRCFYRHLYLPQQAMFASLPGDLGFGAYVEPQQPPVALALLPGGQGFIKEGVQYRWAETLCTIAGAMGVSWVVYSCGCCCCLAASCVWQ